MAVVQDEILDAFITELRERALSEFRHGEKENQDRYERVRELSIKLRNILSHFSEENRQTIESYMEEKDSLAAGIVASLKAAGYGSADKPYPILTGQDCDVTNVKHLIAGEQSMSVFKDTRTLAAKVVGMVDAIMKGTEPEINDTKTYDNGIKIVPSYLCEPVFADVNNYKELLIDSGYYTEDQLK
jgi:ABC-type xylose transport system substrate-binding protein